MTDTNTTGAPLDLEFLDDFAHRWSEAWNNYDAEGVAALCTEDVEFFDPAIGPVHGRRAVADWVRACQRAFPDYRFEEDELPYAARDRAKAILPWRMIGTNTGPMEPPGFAPTNRPLVIDGVDHWWFRDGLVAKYRADYDSQGVARQMGIAPQPGSRGEKALVRLQRLGARFKTRKSSN